jgi:uncharacterized membrane protein (DUF106 family)
MHETVLKLADILFGWMLTLPNDLIFLCLALLTSLCLVLARRLATDQNRLKRCKADKTRLKSLIREAKARNDKAAIARHRATQNAVGIIQARAEIKPLLLALLPLALIATWAFERAAYHPPVTGEDITITFSQPISESGKLVHIAPVTGLMCADGWIRRFEKRKDDAFLTTAEWRIHADQPGQYVLKFRCGGETFEHPLSVGGRNYEHTVCTFGSVAPAVSAVSLRPRMLFGVVPGVHNLGLEPWMVAYLLLTIPVFFLNKQLFKIA